MDEWILETTRPQKHVKFLEKVQHGTALSVINAIKWSTETVMEFNTFLSKLVTIKTLQRFSNTYGPFLKKLPKFETSSAPSAGATTRQTYTLTCGSGILAREKCSY